MAIFHGSGFPGNHYIREFYKLQALKTRNRNFQFFKLNLSRFLFNLFKKASSLKLMLKLLLS